MPTCSAFNCSYKHCSKKTSGKSVHSFPFSRPLILKMWIKNVRRANWSPSRRSVLCSSHFEAECFDRTGLILRLKPDAVPTLFDFPKHLQKEERKHRKKRLNVQQKVEECKTEQATFLPDIIHLRSKANVEQLEDTCDKTLREAYTELASPDSKQEVVEKLQGAKLLPEAQINNISDDRTEEIIPYITHAHSTVTAEQLEDIRNKQVNTKPESKETNHKLKGKVMKGRSVFLEKLIMQPCIGQEKTKEIIVAPVINMVYSIQNAEYIHKQFNTTNINPTSSDTNLELRRKLESAEQTIKMYQNKVETLQQALSRKENEISNLRAILNTCKQRGLISDDSLEMLCKVICQDGEVMIL